MFFWLQLLQLYSVGSAWLDRFSITSIRKGCLVDYSRLRAYYWLGIPGPTSIFHSSIQLERLSETSGRDVRLAVNVKPEKKADADSGTSRIFRHTNHDPSPVALFSVAIKRVAIETVGKNSAAGSPKMHLVWHVLGAISNSSAVLRFHWKSW